MALWRPYADDVPLDLSKTATQETQPLPYSSEYFAPQLPDYPPRSGYFGHISPEGSPSNYLDDTVSYNPVPPPPRHTTLSPPDSLTEAAKRPFDMVDADSLSDDPDFREFERNALRVMAEKNGGALLGNNPRMRRAVRSSHSHAADDAYRRQRERNNVAAKHSRDRRKLREIHLALKVSYLKKELAALRAALSSRVCGRCQQSCLC